MWFNIIKNQELAISQLGGTMDWENEIIPDERDKSCKEKVLEMLKKARNYPQSNDLEIYVRQYDLNKIDELYFCETLEFFRNLPIEERTETKQRKFIKYKVFVAVKRFFRKEGMSPLHMIHTVMSYSDEEGSSMFTIQINSLKDNSSSMEERIKKHDAICKTIFGEYY